MGRGVINSNDISKTFTLCTFNCQSFKSNATFVSSLVESYDIIFLCEHWLSKLEYFLINDQAKTTHSLLFHDANKREQGRPFGGNAFLIRKNSFQNINTIYKDDHIFAIKLEQNRTNIFIIGIYLSSSRNDQTSLEEYSNQLDIIKGIINNFEDEGEIIIVGDFQSFPYKIYDSFDRSSPKRNNFSMHLTDFVESNELELVDITNGSGPTYTYQHHTLPNSSYIDHIALSKNTSLSYSNCTIHSFSSLNMSDHLPISISVSYNSTSLTNDINRITNDSSIPNYAWKDNHFLQLYNERLTEAFTNHKFLAENLETQLLETYDLIVDCATSAYNSRYHNNNRSAASKSWWTPELSRCKNILSFHFQQWSATDFLKDQNCIAYNRYQMARKNFRNAVKSAQNKKLYKQYITLERLKNVNPQKFWNKFRHIKKDTNSRLFTINRKQDKESITSEFANHFEKLLSTPRVTGIINRPIRTIPPITKQNTVTITDEDVITAISQLKSNKSRDSFSITAEHLKHSSCEELMSWLTEFYNFILNHGNVPESMSTSLIIPLVKSYKKSLDNPNNYRGISIIPIFTKILEYLILIISPDIKKSHSSQFGFKSNSSTLHAEFVISETIKYYNDNNSPVYLCSLDAEKAFDSCNWSVLFEKLYFEKQIPLNIVNVISSLYNSGSATVSYLGCKSNQFFLKQGVRQGSILSPYLYNIYTENLLDNITENSVNGTSIYGNFTGIVTYADDILLLSTTLSGLQKLIDTCISYGNNNYIKHNPDKTEFLISGKQQIYNCHINLSNNEITLLSRLRHLGFIWDTEKSNLASLNHVNINERISQFQAVAHTLVRTGIRFSHPNTIIHLYNSLVVPKLTYGLEICNINQTLLNKLDVTGKNILKSFFNISKFSRNYLHSFFNIDHIFVILTRSKLNLFVRLMNNASTSNIILSQLEHGIKRDTFVSNINELCQMRNINFYDLLVQNKKLSISHIRDTLPDDIIESLSYAVEFWHVTEQRQNFKRILEENIPTNN